MQEYFKLQYQITKRKLSDGSCPMAGYALAVLILLVFAAASWLLLSSQSLYVPYIYVCVSLFFTSKLSEIKRNDFLKMCFGNEVYRKIRIVENGIVALPFVVFLVCKQHFYLAIILVAMTILMALLRFKAVYNRTIPTPFYKKPFEFTVGFRNSFFVLFTAYALAIIAVKVDNFNLGIFAFGIVLLTLLGYYMKPENEYFVWSYNCTPAKFLLTKIKTALLYSLYLCLPILVLLGIFYVEYIGILLVCTLLGFLYLITLILAKYSAYPEEMSIKQAVVFTIGLFPPMLIVVIPFFAGQSIHKLKTFLK